MGLKVGVREGSGVRVRGQGSGVRVRGQGSGLGLESGTGLGCALHTGCAIRSSIAAAVYSTEVYGANLVLHFQNFWGGLRGFKGLLQAWTG